MNPLGTMSTPAPTPAMPVEAADPLPRGRKRQGSEEWTKGESKRACAVNGPLFASDALCEAITHGQSEAIYDCMRRGADINWVGGRGNATPLFLATCMGSSSPAFRAVMAHRPDPNIPSLDNLKLTPLLIATANADVEAVRALLLMDATLGDAPYWIHPPYSYAEQTSDCDPKAAQMREIQAMFDEVASRRTDFVAPGEQLFQAASITPTS